MSKNKRKIIFLKSYFIINKKTKDIRASILLDFLRYVNKKDNEFVFIDYNMIGKLLFIKSRKTIDKLLSILVKLGFITIKIKDKKNCYQINEKKISSVLSGKGSKTFFKAPIKMNNMFNDVRISVLAHVIYYHWCRDFNQEKKDYHGYMSIKNSVLENILFIDRRTIYEFVKKLEDIKFIQTQKGKKGKYYKINEKMAKKYFF